MEFVVVFRPQQGASNSFSLLSFFLSFFFVPEVYDWSKSNVGVFTKGLNAIAYLMGFEISQSFPWKKMTAERFTGYLTLVEDPENKSRVKNHILVRFLAFLAFLSHQ